MRLIETRSPSLAARGQVRELAYQAFGSAAHDMNRAAGGAYEPAYVLRIAGENAIVGGRSRKRPSRRRHHGCLTLQAARPPADPCARPRGARRSTSAAVPGSPGGRLRRAMPRRRRCLWCAASARLFVPLEASPRVRGRRDRPRSVPRYPAPKPPSRGKLRRQDQLRGCPRQLLGGERAVLRFPLGQILRERLRAQLGRRRVRQPRRDARVAVSRGVAHRVAELGSKRHAELCRPSPLSVAW
jgi:hypothetical protein